MTISILLMEVEPKRPMVVGPVSKVNSGILVVIPILDRLNKYPKCEVINIELRQAK